MLTATELGLIVFIGFLVINTVCVAHLFIAAKKPKRAWEFKNLNGCMDKYRLRTVKYLAFKSH